MKIENMGETARQLLRQPYAGVISSTKELRGERNADSARTMKRKKRSRKQDLS